jgi:hypothetical protein
MTFAAAAPIIASGVSLLGGFLMNKFAGEKKPKTKQLPTDTPEQKELKKAISQGLLKGEGPLADIFKGYSPEEFEEGVRKPAMKRYEEEVLPGILEKYARNNRGFGSAKLNAEMKGRRNLESDLAEREYQAKQGANQSRANSVLSALGIGVGSKGFENLHTTGYPSAASNYASGAAQGFGEGVSKFIQDLANQKSETGNQPGYGYETSVNAANQVAVGGTK